MARAGGLLVTPKLWLSTFMVKFTAFHIRNVSEGPFLVLMALWLELSDDDNEAERKRFLRHSSESRARRLSPRSSSSFPPRGASVGTCC